MICSRTSASPVSAYWRNQDSTRLTARSSPGRTSATAGFDPVRWITGCSEGRSSTGARRTSRTRTLLPLLSANRNRKVAVSQRESGPAGSSGPDGEQPPLAADALESVGAAVLEHVVRPGDQVMDGAGD